MDSNLPIVKEPVTMSMVTVRNSNAGPADQMWFFKWMKEKGNIDFKVTQIEAAAWPERKNILFASGDLPDIFFHSSFSASDIIRYGQVGKQFIPLNDLIDKYAPNIKKAFEENPRLKAAVTSPDGNIYSLPSYFKYPQLTWNRVFIHTDWLNKLGLKEPETLDDLYAVLKAFKEKDPNGNGKADEIPLGGSWGHGFEERMIVTAALGFNQPGFMGMAVKDGKVVLPEADPLYGEYLKYMNKLYSEGLMDKDIFTQTEVQARAKSSQNIVGLTADGAPEVIAPDHWKEYTALKPLTSKWNQTPLWPRGQETEIGKLMITPKAKHPEVAISFADRFFKDDFALEFYIGPEKGSEDELGYNGWFVNEQNNIDYDYPNGIKSAWDYRNLLSPFNSNQLGVVYKVELFNEVHQANIQQSETSRWWEGSMKEKVAPYVVPNYPDVYFSDDQIKRINELYTPLSDYAATMEAKFITGQVALTEDNLNNYFTQMKKLGADEYVQIHQSGYDDYMKNL